MKKSGLVMILSTFLLCVVLPYLAIAEDSSTPPLFYQPNVSLSLNQASQFLPKATTTTYDALLIEDLAPWNSTSNEDLLNANGLSFKKTTISDASAEDFNNYRKIIIAGDQTTSFYTSYMTIKDKFDNYLQNGGMIEWHACGYGWNNGDNSSIILPGGVCLNGLSYYLDYNFVEMLFNPLVIGVISPFYGSYASHGYFTNFSGLPGINVITTEGVFEGNWPTLIQYPYARGCVVASTQPLEFGFTYGQATGTILQNMIPFFCSKNFIGQASLTLSKDPQDGGTIYGYFPGDPEKNLIDCGKVCSKKVDQGTQIILEAIPNNGFVFSYWDTGISCLGTNPVSIWITEDKTIKAVFDPSPICYDELNGESLPDLHWPLEGAQADYKWYLNQWDYDWGFSQCGGQDLKHVGLDITPNAGLTVGRKVLSAYNGIIKEVYSSGAWGTGIVIEHFDSRVGKFTTTYLHVNQLKGVQKDDPVEKGEQIAIIAAISKSNPHLHFSIRLAPYDKIAQAGALPVVDQNNCECTYKNDGKTYVRPIWPEFFVDPSLAHYSSE